jgi:hypothetical protein
MTRATWAKARRGAARDGAACTFRRGAPRPRAARSRPPARAAAAAFLVVFLVAFGIGFACAPRAAAARAPHARPRPGADCAAPRSGGQWHALRVKIVFVGPAPPPPAPPPAPWYDAPPAPERPAWLTAGAPGFKEDHLLRLPSQAVSTPLWADMTFDALSKILWVALEGDGLAYVNTNHNFLQLVWLQGLRGNHLGIVPDGNGWLSSVADQAAIRVNTWLDPGRELKRVPLGAGARASAYDGATRTVAFTLTNGSVAVLDDASGRVLGGVVLRAANSRGVTHALQSPRTDNNGNLYVALPFDNKARPGALHARAIAQGSRIPGACVRASR